METYKFYKLVENYLKDNPNERKGQATFNVMYKLFPTIANKFRGSDIDCFYNDSNIKIFVNNCLLLINNS